jgi:hypothetical protein
MLSRSATNATAIVPHFGHKRRDDKPRWFLKVGVDIFHADLFFLYF